MGSLVQMPLEFRICGSSSDGQSACLPSRMSRVRISSSAPVVRIFYTLNRVGSTSKNPFVCCTDTQSRRYLVTYSSGLRGRSAKALFTGSNPVVTSNYYMVAVAQLVEHQVVTLNVARSIRVGYPVSIAFPLRGETI